MRRTTVAALLGLVVLTGCGTRAEGGAADPTSTNGAGPSSPSAPPTSPDPVQTCVRQVTYWVVESLRAAPDQGFDYQHMGLSGATYEVVRTVTAEARAADGDPGALVTRRALEECRVLEGPGATPSDGAGAGWP